MEQAIELIRVSTRQQLGEDREGLKPQHETNVRTAKQCNLRIVRTFEIVDVSGANTLHCPEMKELLDWVRRPGIAALITVMQSRLMRVESMGDFGIIVDALHRNNVKLYEAGGIVADLSRWEDRFMVMAKGMMAGHDLETMIQHAWRAKESKRREGKYVGPLVAPGCPGSQMPTGCLWVPDHGWKYIPPINDVRKVYAMFAAGNTNYCAIQREFPQFTRTGLMLMLRNPVYMGWRVIDHWAKGQARRMGENGEQRQRKQVKRPDDEIIRARMTWDGEPIEPAVDPALWNEVQRSIQAKERQHYCVGGTKHVQHYLYSGFVFCGQCGGRLNGTGFPTRYYGCTYGHTGRCKAHTMRQDRLEPILDEFLSKYLTSRKYLTEVINRYRRNLDEKGRTPKTKANIEAEIRRLQTARQRAAISWGDGAFTEKQYHARLASIAHELAEAERALHQSDKVEQITPERILDIFRPFIGWRKLDPPERRRLLAKIRPEIFCDDYKVTRFRIYDQEVSSPSPHPGRDLALVGSAMPTPVPGIP